MKKDKAPWLLIQTTEISLSTEQCLAFLEIVISNYYHFKSLADDLIGIGYCKHESRLVLRSAEILPAFYDLIINPPSF